MTLFRIPNECKCEAVHPWGIGTMKDKQLQILWNLVAFHTERQALEAVCYLNKQKPLARFFVVNMNPSEVCYK